MTTNMNKNNNATGSDMNVLARVLFIRVDTVKRRFAVFQGGHLGL